MSSAATKKAASGTKASALVMDDAALLALHREIVATPSISGSERQLSDLLTARLSGWGFSVDRIGDNLVVRQGEGPVLCLCSHLDTVPASPQWTRPAHDAVSVDGKVYGLGSNDAKASVSAMIAAFVRRAVREPAPRSTLVLALTVQEETGGKGAEVVAPSLGERGLAPTAVIIGEPTGLDVAIAQKGLLILEVRASGRACHAAHGRALAAPNAIRRLAQDLVAIEGIDLGPDHPLLGPITLEPTIVAGGTARNMIPAAASAVLDIRTNPGVLTGKIVDRLSAAVSGEIAVLSERLQPCEIAPDHPLVRAALGARPGASAFGSRGVSDWVFFRGVPGIKVGPGMTERSHTADEFVLESELIEGARFYERTILAYEGALSS